MSTLVSERIGAPAPEHKALAGGNLWDNLAARLTALVETYDEARGTAYRLSPAWVKRQWDLGNE